MNKLKTSSAAPANRYPLYQCVSESGISVFLSNRFHFFRRGYNSSGSCSVSLYKRYTSAARMMRMPNAAASFSASGVTSAVSNIFSRSPPRRTRLAISSARHGFQAEGEKIFLVSHDDGVVGALRLIVFFEQRRKEPFEIVFFRVHGEVKASLLISRLVGKFQ